ncbi:periplasmic nitrate reductase, NapE protein [Niveispirillum cyanobacteriorum]|uniref:Periplasmic nitrate reductase, NapE protein n=1 Tax=Niveispirillum cyanobacteriorum TaxID=1612173 RepID=A0A2K9NL55_9PROT|nr:periplasmic nitrate reductase, NapE protein [Niveispirillum cyanobacteriorum]AUN33800.1 periplasmic nitrate reductase, NapE protein [Niveispirillum cyanobacteriorum]
MSVHLQTRRTELRTFLFLAFGLIPLLSVGVVAAYGFAVWMVQLIAGPPGL